MGLKVSLVCAGPMAFVTLVAMIINTLLGYVVCTILMFTIVVVWMMTIDLQERIFRPRSE